jgi:hypothetical protein
LIGRIRSATECWLNSSDCARHAGTGAQDHLQFFVRVMRLVAARAGQAGDAQHQVGAAVQHPDRRVHGPVKTVQRHRTPQADGFGVADGERFRRQFADHDVEEGNHAEGDHEGHAVDDFFGGHAGQAEQGLQQAGEGRFADPAQAQRGEGDAELAGRQVGVELAVHLEQDAPAQAAGLGDGAHARFTEGDDAELGRHEKAIQRHQDQRQDDK